MNLGINTNKMLLNMNLYKTQSNLHTQRLSTGLKINTAADDPSQILRLNRLKSTITGNDAATRNIQDGVSLLQKTQDSLSVMNNMGQRLKELSVQYNNETLSSEDKGSIEEESIALLKEMNNIKNSTEFNGQKVFSKTDYNIQIGDKSENNFDLKIDDITGINAKELNKSTPTGNSQIPILAPTYGLNIANTSQTSYVKLHDTNGTLIYEGDILNGKFDGYGTLYNNGGKEVYQGDFSQGSYNNYGTQYANDGSISYQGQTLYGVKDGFGSEILSNGYKYNGNYSNGLRTGWGVMADSNNNTLYAGTWDGDKPADGTVISGYTPQTATSYNGNTSTTPPTGTTTGSSIPDFPMDDASIKSYLKTLFSDNYIDKNILTPISKEVTHLGIQEKVLNYHSDWLQSQNTINEDTLSKIQDADMAKELMEKTKSDLLQQTNISLFSQSLDFNKNNILALLN